MTTDGADRDGGGQQRAAASPFDPFMLHPAHAFVNAATLAIGLSGQMAGFMFGAMRSVAQSAGATEPVNEPGRTVPAAPRSAVRAKTVKRRPRMDDLKRVNGIGPKVEQMLAARGIKRLDDIARLSADAVAKLDAELGLDGRIARDAWVEQARALAKG